jgi:hypothetical protein
MESTHLEAAVRAIAAGDTSGAARAIETGYPFEPVTKAGRYYDARFVTRIAARDGFIDRYKGTRLYFPPVLRLISRVLPEAFPFHPNWKGSECHPAFWTYVATVDHIEPVARGGADVEENCVTCSMRVNQIKSVWTLDELGWTILPPGDIREWDGCMGLFVQYVQEHPTLLDAGYFRRWYSAAVSV